MDPQLRAQLRHIVGYSTSTTVDAAGQEVFSSTATLRCRAEPKYREVPVGSSIVEERTNHMLIFDETFPLTEVQTRVAVFWLPDQTTPSSTAVLDLTFARKAKVVHFCYGERGGLDHVEVTV